MFSKSIFFHGLGGSITGGKALSFKELFNTIPVPRERNYDDAFRYYRDNLLYLDNVVLIGSSAGVLPIINICFNYPEKIKKVILLNPGTSMINMNVIPSTISVKIYSGTNDYGRNVYLQGDMSEKHIEVISIPGNHEFRGRDEMINEIIRGELI